MTIQEKGFSMFEIIGAAIAYVVTAALLIITIQKIKRGQL